MTQDREVWMIEGDNGLGITRANTTVIEGFGGLR